MESEATPRDDREQGTSARDKFESRACLRGGVGSGTICSSIRGSRVTVYCRLVRVSFAGLSRGRTMLANWLANLQLGCCCICDLPIGIYESINVKRGEGQRAGEEKGDNPVRWLTARPMRNTANASFIYERRLLSPCPALPMHVPKWGWFPATHNDAFHFIPFCSSSCPASRLFHFHRLPWFLHLLIAWHVH